MAGASTKMIALLGLELENNRFAPALEPGLCPQDPGLSSHFG